MCCKGFLKVMMFIFNGIIFLAGAIILALGIWLKVDSSSLLGLLENIEGASEIFQVDYISYALITAGAVLLIIGFLGCCGAIMESRCMLLTFFSIVLVIFLVEVAGAVLLLVFNDVVDELLLDVEEDVQKDIQTHFGSDSEITDRWNTTMEAFKCCGYRNYTDFTGSPFFESTSRYPGRCCNRDSEETCTLSEASASEVDGCFHQLLTLLEENALLVGGVVLGIAALEIAAMVVSMVLYCDIGKRAR
ncbi:unnamed protein product [Ophioblennius macclurei]